MTRDVSLCKKCGHEKFLHQKTLHQMMGKMIETPEFDDEERKPSKKIKQILDCPNHFSKKQKNH